MRAHRPSTLIFWQNGETKEVLFDGLASDANVDGYEVSLTGTAARDEVLPRGSRAVLEARWQRAPLLFDIQKDEGAFSHDVLVSYRGKADAEQVNLTIEVRYDDGTAVSEKRFWAVLAPGEAQKVSVPGKGPIEQVEIHGTMSAKGRQRKSVK